MSVFVVMGNDFPEAVFDNEGDAEKFIALMRTAPYPTHVRIHWRHYEFTVNAWKLGNLK